MKANPCKRNEEHKLELERMQLNWSDSANEWLISQVGVSQTDERRLLFLIEWI